ncbi:cold shock domain-containing protein [soil metagenome]
MRIEGTLKKWNAERGFGFIAPTQGGQEIFVHVSAIPRSGGSGPALDEALSFEIVVDRNGRKQAVKVERLAHLKQRWHETAARPSRSSDYQPLYAPSAPRRGWLSGAITLVLLIALGSYGYKQFAMASRPLTGSMAAPVATQTNADVIPAARAEPMVDVAYRCDGRKHCSQMTSCSEAKFFLKNCPGVKMDGDHDGIPCEEQWCTGAFGK